MSNSVSQELALVRDLFNEAKFEDALQHIEHIEEQVGLNSVDSLETRKYKGYIYTFLGQPENALKFAEDLYQRSQEMNLPLFTLDALFIKQVIFVYLSNIEDFHKTLELSVKLLSSIPRGYSPEFQEREANLLFMKAWANYLKGNFDLSLDYGNRGFKLITQVDPNSYWIPIILARMALTYVGKGKLKQALECLENASSLIPNEEYAGPMFEKGVCYYIFGRVYLQKGNLNKSLEYFIMTHEINKLHKYGRIGIGSTGWPFFHIISVLILQGKHDQAKNYLQQFKHFTEENDSWLSRLVYKLSQALVLKSSSRLHDRVEAENILKKIIKENKLLDVTNAALIYLCDWYFEEFQISHQMEILEDIQLLIDRLQKTAELQNSYSSLANVKLLQAKLALLQINMVEARKLLSEAQKIAEEHGLQLLAGEISREHDHLLEELKLWESFKKEQSSVEERLKLASVEGVIERLQGKRAIEPLESSGQQPVSLLILAEGGVLLFSYPFTDEWKQDDDLFGSFLSAFSTFSDEFFSQGLDRAKFGEDTILLQSAGSFSICYLFKGQTYFAKQKLEKFAETIQKEPAVWETLEKFEKSSQVAEVRDLPMIENLLTNIFLS
jgi:tetratricopeptide (TPR) repeat protein